jgi:hypothetical protein
MRKTKQKIVKYVPDETVVSKIYIIRGQKVMLDFDLAALYEVETKRLNEQVKRNIERFSEEFMFRLNVKELQNMRSQVVTGSSQTTHFQKNKTMWSQNATTSQKNRKTHNTPYAFTEHGVAMVANVLKSERAIKMSVMIVRAFIQLRKQMLDYATLAEQVKALKLHLREHDVQLNQIYDTLENLLDQKAEQQTWQNRERIGFK